MQGSTQHILIKTSDLDIIYSIINRLSKVTAVRILQPADVSKESLITELLKDTRDSITIVAETAEAAGCFDMVILASQKPFFKAVQEKPYNPKFHAINRGVLTEMLKEMIVENPTAESI